MKTKFLWNHKENSIQQNFYYENTEFRNSRHWIQGPPLMGLQREGKQITSTLHEIFLLHLSNDIDS